MDGQLNEQHEPDVRQLRDELIREALAAGRSYQEAGEFAGSSARTVRRRMSDPGFRSSVLAAMAERNTRLSSLMSEESIGAIERLVDLTKDENPHVSVRAIQVLLSNGIRTRREVELNERISALEARLAAESEEEPAQ